MAAESLGVHSHKCSAEVCVPMRGLKQRLKFVALIGHLLSLPTPILQSFSGL
jgi:hypothetical protein